MYILILFGNRSNRPICYTVFLLIDAPGANAFLK